MLAFMRADSPSSTALTTGLCLATLAGVIAVAQATKARGPGKPLRQLDSTLPVIGNTLDLLRNNDVFHDWLSELVQKFDGAPFVIKLAARPDMIIVSTPEAFEDITKTQFDRFGKGPFQYDILYDLLGTALSIVDGERWKYQRKIFANLFSARQMREVMQPIIRKHASTLFSIYNKSADSGNAIDIFRLFNRFTMESFSEIGLGIQMGCLGKEEAHPFETAFDQAQELSARRFVTPVLYWKLERFFGIGSEGRLKRAMEVISKTTLGFINDSIERRRRGESLNSRNIVSLVLDSVDESEVVDPELLRSIVIASLAAGRDTTSETLSWFVHVISQHPEAEAKIREEVLVKIPKLAAEDGYIPTMEDVAGLVYLEACIKEVTRLYPAVPFSLRHACEDTYLSDGTFIPAGTDVGIPYYAMSRRAEIWGDDCMEFRPERFIDPTTGMLLQLSPFRYTSFYAGPRSCPGRNLALKEMKMLISSLLSRFHVVPVPGQTVTYLRNITLTLRDPLMVNFERVAA